MALDTAMTNYASICNDCILKKENRCKGEHVKIIRDRKTCKRFISQHEQTSLFDAVGNDNRLKQISK